MSMTESSVPEIETERILFREATPVDLDEWGNRIFGDPDVMRYMPKMDLAPRARAERALGVFRQAWANHPCGGWLIKDKADGQLVGHCKVEYLTDTDEFELGYALAKPYWGKGMATEVARAAVRFGFETAGLTRIMAVVVPENIASSRVLDHIGFVFEKAARYYDLDVAYYAIERHQFSEDGSFYRVRSPKPG
jgi:ribosomal-protein-alanine N-acetyltransferase